MLATPSPHYQSPRHHRETCDAAARWSEVPFIIDGVLVYVEDVDAHFERARAAGANILSQVESGAASDTASRISRVIGGCSSIGSPHPRRACAPTLMASNPKRRKVDPLNELRQRHYEAGHGDADAFNRQHAKGKLTARERINRLVDRNSFEEIDIFATHRASGFGLESRRVPGDGVVTGMAKIDGRDVVLFSHDSSGLRGFARRGFRGEGHQGDGPRAAKPDPDHRDQRLRRRTDPGRRCFAGRLRGDLLANVEASG